MSPGKLNDSGPAVGAIQQALLEAGETVDATELTAMLYGPSTRDAVTDFQLHHADAQGHALDHDGVVGPKTAWALEHPSASPFKTPGWHQSPVAGSLALVAQAAVGDIGRKEDPDGSNDGPDLVKFSTGGLAWCAMAVSAWWAAYPGGSPFKRKSAVADLVAWGRANGGLVGIADPGRVGDLGCFLRGDGHGHVGLIVGVGAGGKLSTVEGNCGNAVRGMIRDRAKFQALVRPVR